MKGVQLQLFPTYSIDVPEVPGRRFFKGKPHRWKDLFVYWLFRSVMSPYDAFRKVFDRRWWSVTDRSWKKKEGCFIKLWVSGIEVVVEAELDWGVYVLWVTFAGEAVAVYAEGDEEWVPSGDAPIDIKGYRDWAYKSVRGIIRENKGAIEYLLRDA